MSFDMITVLDENDERFLCQIEYEIEIHGQHYFLLKLVEPDGEPLTDESIVVQVLFDEEGIANFMPVLDEELLDNINEYIQLYISTMD